MSRVMETNALPKFVVNKATLVFWASAQN